MKLREKLKRRKGAESITGIALSMVVAVVALFIGLYMISQVSTITSINSTSDFYPIFQSLTSKTGTIYDVMVLVIIVVALGVAIAVLRGFGEVGSSSNQSSNSSV